MISKSVTAVLCFLSLSLAVLATDITVPAEVVGKPSEFVQVPADTRGEIVQWVVIDPGLNLFPVTLLKSSKVAVVSAQRPGKYRLLAYTATDGKPSEPAICLVKVGDQEPPAPPAPIDPFTGELQKLYDADQGPPEQKRQCRIALAALYRQAVEGAADKQLLTTGNLHTALSRAAAASVPEGLTDLRKRLALPVIAVLGVDPTAELTDDKRATAASLFRAIAKALEAIQ